MQPAHTVFKEDTSEILNMFEWLKRLASGITINNRTGLQEELARLLESDFARLDPMRPGISARLLRYALDGDGEEVLAETSAIEKAGRELNLLCAKTSYNRGSDKRARFFSRSEHEDPAFLLRLARIYEAASLTVPRNLSCPALAGGHEWVEVFLLEATQFRPHILPQHVTITPRISFSALERMIEAGGGNPEVLIRGALFIDPEAGWDSGMTSIFTCFRGFGESIRARGPAVNEALSHKNFNVRVHVLDLLGKLSVPVESFAPKIVELAVSSSKLVRDAAEALLGSISDGGRALLAEKASRGSNDERIQAVRLLSRSGFDGCRELLEKRLQEEKSPNVLAEIQSVLEAPLSIGGQEIREAGFDLPPVPEVNPEAPLSEDFYEALRRCAEEYNQTASDFFRKHPLDGGGPGPKSSISPRDVDEVFRQLQTLRTRNWAAMASLKVPAWNEELLRPFVRLLAHPEMKLIHVIRLLILLGHIRPEQEARYAVSPDYVDYFTGGFAGLHAEPCGLREVAAVLRAIGMDDSVIGIPVLESNRLAPSIWWEEAPEMIWPYFAERMNLLEEALASRPGPHADTGHYFESDRRRNALRIIRMMPEVPARFRASIWEMALSPGKGDRPYAQRCAEKIQGFEKKVLLALTSTRQETRAIAAEWLGRIACEEAVPALRAAVGKEKREVAKAAMLKALESLGVTIDEYLDRDTLEKQAAKAAEKPIPAALDWFPFQSLPAVRWDDTQSAVPESMLRWMIVKSYELKSPEPDPVLRRFSSRLEAEGREALGRMVLEQWIAEDTVPAFTEEEASQKARQFVKHYRQLHRDVTDQQLFERVFDNYASVCRGSAIGQKGLLAVTAACGGRDAVSIAERYIRRWYGSRLQQCRALIQMVSWIEHPAALELLVSIAGRFRTTAIREEAARQINVIALRHGWSDDEKDDRTIPAAGLDRHASVEFDYGTGKFSARLEDDFSLTLVSEDGTRLASLPGPAEDEDETRWREARREFAALKKDLKAILKALKERLYEAMCSGRSWKYSDWDQYLNSHPVAGRLCRSLVWSVSGSDGTRYMVPVKGGGMIDSTGNQHQIQPDCIVRVAHACSTPADERRRWIRWFASGKIAAPFEQFRRKCHTIPEDQLDSTRITDFEGHVIDEEKLRRKAARLGYAGGRLEDDRYGEYRKNFPRTGIQAVIRTAVIDNGGGSAVILALFFQGVHPSDPYASQRLMAREVPPALLSECWNDLKSIASLGSGFDPEWKGKTGEAYKGITL